MPSAWAARAVGTTAPRKSPKAETITTTMVAAVLDHGHFDPTVINGGIIHAYGSNARVGDGEWMVVEADEVDEIGGPGFWCNQLRFAREGRPNAKFTTAELEAPVLPNSSQLV